MLNKICDAFNFTRLLGACALVGLTSLPGWAQTSTSPNGWNAIGLVEGQDTVESQKPAAGEDAVLVIEKKSPYQAGQALQVFKSFAATAWRGKRISISYSLDTLSAIDTRQEDGILPQVQIRIQCEKASRSSRYTISKGMSKFPSLSLELEVPKDAAVCGFGFSILKPMKITVKKLQFAESFTPPPAPTMEGQQLFPSPKPGTALPELEVAKPAMQ